MKVVPWLGLEIPVSNGVVNVVVGVIRSEKEFGPEVGMCLTTESFERDHSDFCNRQKTSSQVQISVQEKM